MKQNEINDIIITLYNIYTTKFINICPPDNYKSVKQMINIFKQVNQISDVNLSDPITQNIVDLDGDKQFFVQFKAKLYLNDLKSCIIATINCIPTESNDINGYYSIVLQLDNNSNMVNENFKTSKTRSDDELDYKSLAKDLAKAKTFEDIKCIIKTYLAEGIVAGAALTFLLLSFGFSNTQRAELTRELINDEMYYVYDYDSQEYYDDNTLELTSEDFEDIAADPDWKLLSSDVEATVYNAVPSQCNNDVKHTASMFELDLKQPEKHRVIAMERTMMAKYGLKYGSIVRIEGTGAYDGEYQIQDTMNKRFAGQEKIDILVNNKVKYGKWNNVKIYALTNTNILTQIKDKMLDAKNQASIDKRQKNVYKSN